MLFGLLTIFDGYIFYLGAGRLSQPRSGFHQGRLGPHQNLDLELFRLLYTSALQSWWQEGEHEVRREGTHLVLRTPETESPFDQRILRRNLLEAIRALKKTETSYA